jgi:hypothetical protein
MSKLAVVKNTSPGKGLSLQPSNMGEAMELATMFSKSSLVPFAYKGKPEDTLVAMMMGTELGLNPIQSLQNIAVINGRPAIYGDAMMALVQNHPAFGSIKETFDKKTMTAKCVVRRKSGPAHTQTYSEEDARIAGLWDGREKIYSQKFKKDIDNPSPWHCHPKRMLAMRARGFALRNQFADALLGLITAEEAQDYPVDTNTGEIVQQAEVVEELPIYTDEDFQANKEKWEEVIIAGKGNVQGLINKISAKYQFTESQINEMKSWEKKDGCA